MRYSEFIQVPENTASEDAFKALIMLFRQNADNEKNWNYSYWLGKRAKILFFEVEKRGHINFSKFSPCVL
mgnify:CR=1 FL=1